MPKIKVTVSLDRALVREIDALVARDRFPNRSSAIEAALAAELARTRRARLSTASRLLSVAEDRAMADGGLDADAADWPCY